MNTLIRWSIDRINFCFILDKFVRVWGEQLSERRRRETETLALAQADPFDLEAQQKIAEHIRSLQRHTLKIHRSILSKFDDHRMLLVLVFTYCLMQTSRC